MEWVGVVGAVPEELTALAASPSSATGFCSSFSDSDLEFAAALSCRDTFQDSGRTRSILTTDDFRQLKTDGYKVTVIGVIGDKKLKLQWMLPYS